VGTQVFPADDGTAIIGVFEQLDQPTRERVRYTIEDQEALIRRWGHLPVDPRSELRLAEVYASRIECGLISLEEGVAKQWSWRGRVVLVGDAAHKSTPRFVSID
jgi:2-polyprenyl-6-methoxyphenol hydroxylase-like FAD-dependent oxidoreductase